MSYVRSNAARLSTFSYLHTTVRLVPYCLLVHSTTFKFRWWVTTQHYANKGIRDSDQLNIFGQEDPMTGTPYQLVNVGVMRPIEEGAIRHTRVHDSYSLSCRVSEV